MDRRIIKTKKAIRNAFVKLLTEKDFNDITVTDIAQFADINRKTFYNYYTGVYQVVEEIENDIIGTMERLLANINFYQCIEQPLSLYKQLTDIFESDGEFYTLLLQSKSTNTLFKKIENKLIEMTRDEASRQLNADPADLEYIITFIYSGETTVFKKWINSDRSIPIERIAHTISELLLYGLKGLINQNTPQGTI